MSTMYDLYQPGSSWLHRMDPRAKLLLVAAGCALALLFSNVWIMLGLLLWAHLSLWSARTAGERIAMVWKATLPTMILIWVFWVALYRGQGPVICSLGPMDVTPYDLAQGGAAALRIGALAFIVMSCLFTTDQATLVRGLVALGLPYEWGLTLAIALRYLPTMAGIFRMISEAQQARALDLTRGNLIQRARAHLPIIVPMLITALRTAENLSRALESRALGASRRRTYLRGLRFRPADLAWTIGIIATTVLLFWARFALGFGVHPLRPWP